MLRLIPAIVVVAIVLSACQAPNAFGGRQGGPGVGNYLGGENCVTDVRPPSLVSVAHEGPDTDKRMLSFEIATLDAPNFSLYSPASVALSTNATSATLNFFFPEAGGVKCNDKDYPALGSITKAIEPYVPPHSVGLTNKSEIIEFTIYGVTTHFVVVVP